MAVSAGDQSILYVASHGMEDSYRATLIFAAANAVKAAGARDVKVALLGEATWLARKEIKENFGLGAVSYASGGQTLTRSPLSKLIYDCGEAGVKIGV